ncbi:MAG: hypothetical protein IAE78_26515 [Myxococcus sp.]|nr:hypothetical protein [Myxococcus sp.]
MKRILAALAAASWLVACGSNTTTPTPTGPQQYDQTQKAVTPKGSIVVRVVDVGTANPLEGVTVKALGTDVVGTTNADGIFKFDGLVVNSNYNFIFEKAGYVRTRQQTSIPGTAGNSPLEGGLTSFSIEMFPTNGSISGFVFLPNGTPAPNATVYVDHRTSSGGELIVTAQTGMDGSFSLTGLATRPTGLTTTVYARWYDENGDMQADYATTQSSVTVFPGQAARTFLTYGALTQRVIASNINDGVVAAGEDLQFTFALPLFTGSLEGTGATPWVLNANSTGAAIPVEGTFMSPVELRVRPSLNSLREGERYTLRLELRNANANNPGSTGSTFTGDFSFQVRPAMVAPFTTQVSGLTVVNPVPTAPFGPSAFDYNDNRFTVSWLPAVGAVRYEVYARDTRGNPNYVLVQNVNATGAPRQETTFALSSSFNLPFSTALAGGNRVNFAVVGVDAYGGRAPLMGATPVEVRDTIPPTSSGPNVVGSGTVDAINDTTSPATIRLRISYSEPMDPMSTVTFTSSATNAPMSSWSWETNNSGILTLTVGANNDASGAFVIRGGRDVAGNDIARAGDLTGSLSGRRELLVNGDFQMGSSCGLGSWTPSTTGSAPMPAAVNNNGAISGSTNACAAVLGSIPGTTPSTGRARIIQDVTLPPLMGTGYNIEWTGRYRIATVPNQAATGATYSFQCRATNPAETTTFGTLWFFPVINTSTFVSGSSAVLSAQAGNQVRILCESENTNMMAPGFGALYLDEMSVALVKPGTL